MILKELEKNNDTNPPINNNLLCFYKYSRYANNLGVEIDIIDINYNLEYSESQILDPDTFEFTDFLKSRFDRDYYWNEKHKP